eukprot:TRINITY_DN4612_c0_g1_i2.p1 TRINITY_DN4612_c0_g1~~TRINITY_DN4612_c0_g1_i2.p1  ORF type:complete len:386 (-),score=45.48 TRINITY_DN4612_c0_g1_i2:130-1287(-)
MSYDDLAFDFERKAPETGVCSNCGDIVMLEFKNANSEFKQGEHKCPNCGSLSIRELRRNQMESDNNILQLINSIANMMSGGGNVNEQTMREMMEAQRNVDVDALMTALLNDTSRKAPPADPNYIANLPCHPLAPQELIEPYLHIDTLSPSTPFTLPSFGPSFVALHSQVERKVGDEAETPESEPAPAHHQQQHLEASVVAVDSPEGDPLRNAPALAGCFALFRRGKITFAEKVRRAQAAGAAGVLVIQNLDTWPYIMADLSNASHDLRLPCVFMIPKAEGEALLKTLKSSPAAVRARCGTREITVSCCICREDFERDSPVLRLPCSHFYHKECVMPWFEKRNTCPLCRHELPTGDPSIDARLNQPAVSEPSRNTFVAERTANMWG